MNEPKPSLSAQAILIRQLRRNVMMALNMLYPTKVLVGTLYRAVVGIEPTYEKALFVKDVFYLKDKGYVLLTSNPMKPAGKVEQDYIVLTAAGKEIAEQTMIDPAMEI